MQPAVDRGRCVHSGRVAASCIACLAACPRTALSLDGGAPEIRAADCDGCGLCVSACPRGAISLPLLYARGELAGRAACFAACEKVVADESEGRVACLHAIGLDVLLRAMATGTRVWLVARGDCATCARDRGHNLPDTVIRLNDALRVRGDPGIVLKETDARRWRLACATRAAPEATRRQFLETYIGSAVSERTEAASDATARACFDGDGPVPHAIHVDRGRCIACHACARVCPDGAIRLEEGAPAYMFDHSACSGCGLCVDVCDRNAVRLYDWEPGGHTILPLRLNTCNVCGTSYHSLADDAQGVCHVCALRPARIRPDRLYE